MLTVNVDQLCEPIEVILGGKTYVVEDIPQNIAKRMAALSQSTNEDDAAPMVDILAEILGADKKDIKGLGIRKLGMTIKGLFDIVNNEVEAKNVPKAVPTK
ncbi:MAG: hypothetical protein PHQ43_00890 [Dehalococcoidales bacterium]|nr:hypothetical protein [Dehalococcoidales bacterium]